MKKKIAIFGDSVLRGVIYDEIKQKHTFSKAIDWQRIKNELNIEIQNYAKMGATILDGKKRLDQYLDGKPQADIVLIEFGGNDCDFDWQKVSDIQSKNHQPKVTPQVFKQTLRQMVDQLRIKRIKPILMTLPTIDARRYFNWITQYGRNTENILYFLGDIEHIYRFHELYNLAIMEVSIEAQVDLIDVRKVFLENGKLNELICYDGIHPSPFGEELIVEHIISRYQAISPITKSKLYNRPVLTYN